MFSKRVIDADELARAFGFSLRWVYKYTHEGCPDPIPRCKTHRLRFDTHSAEFKAWILRHTGVDLTDEDRVDSRARAA
jgi:phage terminase Nu1 subunit (DNA packaging protein)